MARVGPVHYEACLRRPHAREMDFTGRSMKGMVYVAPVGIESDAKLEAWIADCTQFTDGLPPKD